MLTGAVLLRLTLRDRIPGLSTFYYATPFPVLIIGSALLLGSALLHRHRNTAAGTTLLLLASTALHFHTSVFTARVAHGPEPGFRVLFWNAGRLKAGREAVMDCVAAADADVIGLVEAGPGSETGEWKRRFPGYSVQQFRGGMLVMIRGRILSAGSVELSGRARFGSAMIELEGKHYRLLLADIHADPLLSKRAAFERLGTLLDRESNPAPVIVMGDFNTPLESVWFDGLRRRGLMHAFEAAGRGRVETWPACFPLLAIDHVWVGQGLRAAGCTLQQTGASDHRSVLTVLSPGSLSPSPDGA